MSDVHDFARIMEGVVLFVVVTALGMRTARSSIKWNRQGIVAGGTVATRRLVWSQITGFEHREAGGPGVRLRDGRWVRLVPYPRNQLNKPEQANRHPGSGPAGGAAASGTVSRVGGYQPPAGPKATGTGGEADRADTTL